MKVDINGNDLLLCNSLTLAIFCLLHGFRCILLPTQQSKKPNPNLNMLNFYILSNWYIKKKQNRDKRNKKPNLDLNMLDYKFANKLNLPWDCDDGSEQSSLSLWLLLGFERDSLNPSPNPNPFFTPTDCGKGSQQSSPIPLLLGLCWIGFRRYISILTILRIYWASPIIIFENVVVGMP